MPITDTALDVTKDDDAKAPGGPELFSDGSWRTNTSAELEVLPTRAMFSFKTESLAAIVATFYPPKRFPALIVQDALLVDMETISTPTSPCTCVFTVPLPDSFPVRTVAAHPAKV